jgi:hypothetical protein
MIPYLLLADLQNTILAAILTFSDRLVYPAYASVTVGRLSALDDQALAGVIMWVPGSLVFLVAAIWLAMEALSGARAVPGVASSDSYGFGSAGHPESTRWRGAPPDGDHFSAEVLQPRTQRVIKPTLDATHPAVRWTGVW